MIAFIDTEVSPQTKKVVDYGAVRSDGAVLHSHSKSDFDAFISECDAICGHNIFNHDLKYTTVVGDPLIVDTLFLSPLLFPKRPYHHLVKDDKLQVEELNNPLNDSIKARELFNDEVVAWNELSPQKQEILYRLLYRTNEFKGFFKYIGYSLPNKQFLLDRFLNAKQHLASLITEEFDGKICSNADYKMMIENYPIELAYCLSVIGVDDVFSITPAWVLRNYPQVVNVMNALCNKSCGECSFCQQRLKASAGLKEFFGLKDFRVFDGVPLQQNAVESAICGESLLAIFPTGGGKSLTFQLPALMAGRNTHGLTVVISPLQSLMKDQVDNLVSKGISEVVAINGLLDPIERSAAIRQVEEGLANILYIAPEMLRSKTIERLLTNRNVIRFVIDEAHCFSAWGHDFRVDYLYIGDFIKQLQKKKQQNQPIAVSCFTATAKQKVVSDICDYFRSKLGLELRIFASNADRKNLKYSVRYAETDEDKYNQLRSLIIGRNCPSIVYVSRTNSTFKLAQRLADDGVSALPFNGKMDASEKVKNQNAFMNGDVQVIVATSAFGMGVDKGDVGLVVHYNISDSLENYVQEAGRAGRNPKMRAECYVLFNDSDLDKHFILLNQTKLSLSEIQQVWKAIKDLTVIRERISCSALDIARQAGWNEEVYDIETRVRAAIAALEDAGYLQRGSNSPHVFATGITVRNMDEARKKLTMSTLFDEQSRKESVRIIKSLISARATAEGLGTEAESRVDYLADILGMDKESVIRNINLMRQDGLLADTRDMQALVSKATTRRNLDAMLKLEQFLLQKLNGKTQRINYKELNEEAQKSGLSNSNVKRLRTLLHFLSLKEYIRKEEECFIGIVSVHLQDTTDVIKKRFELRTDICRFIIDRLKAGQDVNKEVTLVNFSVVELLKQFNNNQGMSMFANAKKASIEDIEEALLYLAKTDLMKIEGGFIVIYNTMQISRKADRRTRYGKEQYRLLDEFYKQRIQQIHIVGEYANLMVRDYDAARRFVNDYFTMDFRKFISLYFKEERSRQINQNVTPTKYKQLFGNLSNRQLEIIKDKQSKYIVVAAGPGSGKTKVLVHKLASLLLLEDVKHEQLLMLTFSRAAATEFKKRLIELVGNAAHYVEIKTFHSYSFDLIGKQGNLDDAKDVVRFAAEAIKNGDVEPSKITKSVLVIDEAQDMGADDFQLVKALIGQNEDLRVIAVGDDDQNVFAFRGADSKYMQSFVRQDGAKLYEMVENYRSSTSVVNCANLFLARIPCRLKQTPIHSVTGEDGRVVSLKSLFDTKLETNGRVAVLTRKNEETLQIAYELEQRGIHATVAQSMGVFKFCNLAEVRYFQKQFKDDDSVKISKDKWQKAKQRTLDAYASSTCLKIMQNFFADFEATHNEYYVSDLREFIFESNIEDFIVADNNSVFVCTIHKSKGREFDTVYLVSSIPDERDVDSMRTYYVGLTRAKMNLYLVRGFVAEYSNILIPLTMHDVWLDFFKNRKNTVLDLKSGEDLEYKDGYLHNNHGKKVVALSVKGKEKILEWEEKGYGVTGAKVSYIVAWRPIDSDVEYAVCLANIVLSKN